MGWLSYEAQMETAVFLHPQGLDSLGGHVFRNTAGTVHVGVYFGECGRTNDILSDFQRGCFAVDWERVLWQRKIKMSPEVLVHR